MSWLTKCQTNEATYLHFAQNIIPYRPIHWTGLTASKEADLEDSVPGIQLWVENMNESHYK